MLPFSSAVLREVALYGLVLNAAWESVQLVTLYDCLERWKVWQRVFYPAAAILGDTVFVLMVVLLARVIIGSDHLVPPDGAGWLVLLCIGFVVGVILEWMALALGLWAYAPAMPTLSTWRHRVGLSPVVQMSLLPALSLQFAAS